MVMLRCVQVAAPADGAQQDVGVFCNVAAATLGNPPRFAQCLDFLEANRALAPSLVLEFKQATFRNLGRSRPNIWRLWRSAATAFPSITSPISGSSRANLPTAASLHQGARLAAARSEANLGVRHSSIRPFRSARPLRIDLIAERIEGRTRRGRSARL